MNTRDESIRPRVLAFALALSLAAAAMLLTAWIAAAPARAQTPLTDLLKGKPAAGDAAKSDPGEKPQAAPTKDNPEATVATPAGPIKADAEVDDSAVEETLEDLLPKYPGVRTIDATVRRGTVELDGHVEDDDVRDQMTRVATKVVGVRMVVNRLKTDAQVMTATELVMGEIAQSWQFIGRKWLLALLALGIVLASTLLARAFNAYSETLLAPFVANLLVRSVIGSLIGSALLVGGVLFALTVLNLTQAVLSILGLAGVVGLAVGFAFRDIAENFIASILLGLRRPFRVGDYVTVAGYSGVVKSLNTRATVLVTLEGNHIRIPNNVIYKEILVNSSASSSARGSFDVMIPYGASTAAALDAITGALRDVEGVLADPPARALIDGLDPNGVRIRSYFWMPAQGVDGFKLNSDVRLRVKVALQQVGILPPPAGVLVSVVGRVPVEVIRTDAHRAEAHPTVEAARPGAVVSPEQARANLAQDAAAAVDACNAPPSDQPTPIEHVLNQAETRVSDEGANLLANGKH